MEFVSLESSKEIADKTSELSLHSIFFVFLQSVSITNLVSK